MRFPRKAEVLCKALAERVTSSMDVGKIDAVVSPALGGIVVGHEVARALDVMSIFAEKEEGRLADLECRPTTAADLQGPLKEQLDTIRSRIKGEFRGWSGETVFRLEAATADATAKLRN